VALAAKAILAKGDLPSDWTEYKAGTGVMTRVTPTSRLGCSLPKGQPGAYPWSVAFDGGIYQKAKLNRFVASSAQVFRDEAAAKAHVATLRSAEYVACWTMAKAETAAKQAGAAPGSTWRAGPVGAGAGPLEAHLRFRYQALVEGKVIDANGFEDILVFRQGRTVMILAPQAVASKADPSDIDATTAKSLDGAAGRLLKRVGS
jgi:hypothetical protein